MITIFSLLTIFIGITLLINMVRIGTTAQSRFALISRLDICAATIAKEKISLFQKLHKSNIILQGLQLLVYSLRGLKVLLPPTALATTISEQSALQAMRLIESSQNFLIKTNTAKELLLKYCKKTPFSQSVSYCNFKITNSQDFFRKTTAFPDIPGLIELRYNYNEMIQCQAPFSNNVANKIKLHSPFGLSKNNFSYEYIQ